MADKPVLFTIDDDPEVLRAVARDLRRHYGEDYRVLRAGSGAEALEAVQELKRREEPVALFLVDQRMPQMSGVEFVEEASKLFPESKKALLTAYADTEAAIRAINRARVDYYLMKPWDPPQERLYPIIDDLLGDWKAGYRPSFRGIRIVGDRWSPETHRIKDFLARNQVPYRWLDVETSDEACDLLETSGNGFDRQSLPLVFFPDHDPMAKPSNAEIAEGVGLQMRAEKPFYDLAIIGGGPAGLAAAVYGASEGLHTVLIEKEAPGGQAGTSSRIENYLGFPSGLSGGDLARRAVTQARRFEAEILAPLEVNEVCLDGPYRIVRLSNGEEVSCHTLMVTTGVQYRKLETPGVEALTGRGVYYGATMAEAMACRDEDVYVVGAGNSAGQAAVYNAGYARQVTLLVRSDGLEKSMSQYLIDQIERTENIDVRLRTEVGEAHGESHLEKLTLVNNETDEKETVEANALFILIGAHPQTDWLDGTVARDERGFILTGPDLKGHEVMKAWPLDRDPFLLETSVPGIFAAGDVRHGSVKRVASGVGEGSVAISFIHQHLSEL